MKKGSGSVALFADDAATGFDNMTQDDLALPYVRILGQLSAQVNEGDGKYIEGAKPGMIYNNVTHEIFDGKKGIKVVPCYYKKDYPEKSDKGDGNPLTVATHLPNSPIIKTGKREGSKIRLPNGNYLEETAYYYVLMETKAGGMTPALITMKSSQLSVSKNWNSMMKTIQIEDGKGSWYGWSITQDRIMGQEDKGLYKSAKDFSSSVSDGTVQAKADVEEKSDSTPY